MSSHERHTAHEEQPTLLGWRVLFEFLVLSSLCALLICALVIFVRPNAAVGVSWADWAALGIGFVPPGYMVLRGVLLKSR